jgi:hypothetical protein
MVFKQNLGAIKGISANNSCPGILNTNNRKITSARAAPDQSTRTNFVGKYFAYRSFYPPFTPGSGDTFLV